VTVRPQADVEPCRCALCLALLNLAVSAERNHQAAKAERRMQVVGSPRRKRKEAA
jgi:hypothetical protein